MSPVDVLATPHGVASLVRIGVDAFRAAQPLPDWRSSEEVRGWLRRLSPAVSHLARRTATTIDEASAALVERIVESDALWEAVWTVLPKRLAPSPPDHYAKRILAEACAVADHNLGSTDPAVVLALIDAVVDVVSAVRPESPPPTPPSGAAALPAIGKEADPDTL